jgi:hypothetical protein
MGLPLEFSEGGCTTCGVTVDPIHNLALIPVSAGQPGSLIGAFQFLDLSAVPPSLGPVRVSPAPLRPPLQGFPRANISGGVLIDPFRNLLSSPAETGNYEVVNVSTFPGAFYENNPFAPLTFLGTAGEDCATGIAVTSVTTVGGNGGFFVSDLSRATFIAGSPGTWTAPSQVQDLGPVGGVGIAVAQGTHTGVLLGSTLLPRPPLTAIALPATSTGIPAITDWVSCSIPGFTQSAAGNLPQPVTAYQSPNSGDAIALLQDFTVNGGVTTLAVVDLTKMLDINFVPRNPFTNHVCLSGTLPSTVVRLISLP